MTLRGSFSRFAVRAALFFALFFSINCQQLMDLLDPSNKVDDTSANTNADLDKAGTWTILVYLDAANNLEGAGVQDVLEMENAGILSGNKTYVLMDRMTGYSNANNTNLPTPSGNSFTGVVLFSVIDGVIATIDPAAAPVPPYPGNPNWPTGQTGAAGDEVNMGDRKTLENFIIFGLKKAIADGSDYVYLDIWDHGAGWGGGAYGGNAVAWDDEPGANHDALSIDEIRTAITNAYAAVPNRKITIIGFDACYMGTIENAYSFKDQASIMIGSEEVEPGAGWQYTNWLPKGKVSPRDVAKNVVNTFKASYNNSGEQVTLSAIDLSKLAGISTALEAFLNKLPTKSPSAIANARLQSQSFNNDLSVDLYDFVDKVSITESNALKNMISASLVAEAHTTGGKVAGSRGMTVYFPQSKNNYDTSYNATLFAQQTRWDDFVSGKLVSIEVSSTEPGDATCGAENNDSAANAKYFTAATTCTGYIYTPSDVDIYRFRVTTMGTTSTLTVSLSNIPSGADFDVLLFNTDVSPSAPMAAAVLSGNTSQTFTVHLDSATEGDKGWVEFTSPSTIDCKPANPNDAYMKQGWCYGQGINTTLTNNSPNFYLVVVGKNNSYNQAAKYTLSLSAANATIASP